MPDQGPSFHQQAVLWGQAYEVLVKNGVLLLLMERKLLSPDRASLAPWRAMSVKEVVKSMHLGLDLTDPDAMAHVSAAVHHLARTAGGTGYTAMRAYLDSIAAKARPFIPERLKLRALWCPLTRPGFGAAKGEALDEQRAQMLEAFATEFGIDGVRDPHWAGKGQPANADLILWLDYAGKGSYLLVQEFGFDMPADMKDFRQQAAHLEELQRYCSILDRRGVFSRVTAEVDHEQFELSEDMRHYLPALTAENKPLYKLCQACSYAATVAELLGDRGGLAGPTSLRALAVTPNGLESVAAQIGTQAADPSHGLMQQLGAAYRDTRKIADDDQAALTRLAAKVFDGTLAKLPKPLRSQMKAMRGARPAPGEDFDFTFEEQTSDFHNPDDAFDLDQAVDMIPTDDALNNHFGGDARAFIGQEMAARLARRGRLSLRDIHASAIVAGLRRAARGQLNLIALEGNPGIGKTTAVRDHLASTAAGYFLLYVSPRVIINRDVTASLARVDGQPSGILALTTNSDLIATAKSWYSTLVAKGLAPPRKVDSAVVADGVADLKEPDGSTLVITPQQEQEVESEHTSSKLWKSASSEFEDHVHDVNAPGVLRTLATTAGQLKQLNPRVNRLVITAAIQGFKTSGGRKSTIDALSSLFSNKWDSLAGVAERRDFARKMPTIVVMVDELAGDGAGAPFVHAIAAWLRQEFLDPFEDEPSPFTVVLIASDASLGNEVVLDRYLNSGERTPDKVLVSKSRGKRPFDLAVLPVAVNGRKVRALHVMTNSFPASKISMRYVMRMSRVRPGETESGEELTVRQAIRKMAGDVLLSNAVLEIQRALKAQASQVIYFAQDKLFLRSIKEMLLDFEGLTKDSIQVLDHSVPAHERKRLVEPQVRDRVRVFLMTSSGARGVSFPKTDWIIASIPRFSIESQLMEIAQLIYRGRGKRLDAEGQEINGDTVPRHLVFVIDDFLVVDEQGVDERQWLRQVLDLMTLLVMLRSTVFTRITGDAGLDQPLALVPVGAVGTQEFMSLMSQQVLSFMKEARLYRKRTQVPEDISEVSRALDNVEVIFTRTNLQGLAKPGSDARSYVRSEVARAIHDVLANLMRSMLTPPDGNESLLPAHMSMCGPVVIENWSGYEKQEVFSFEEHDAALSAAARQLKAQLHVIKSDRRYPSSLRNPAEALLRLLYREDHDEANEFRTLKALKSSNTWVVTPSGYPTFMAAASHTDGREFILRDADEWRSGLSCALGSDAAIPPIASYRSFPWAAAVGQVSPMNMDLVFDDRYFMASNEFNLLNTLLLSRATEPIENPVKG